MKPYNLLMLAVCLLLAAVPVSAIAQHDSHNYQTDLDNKMKEVKRKLDTERFSKDWNGHVETIRQNHWNWSGTQVTFETQVDLNYIQKDRESQKFHYLYTFDLRDLDPKFTSTGKAGVASFKITLKTKDGQPLIKRVNKYLDDKIEYVTEMTLYFPYEMDEDAMQILRYRFDAIFSVLKHL